MSISEGGGAVNTSVDDRALGDRLLVALRNRLGAPGLAYAAAPRRLGGGFWADMFVLRLAGAPEPLPAEVVARIVPDPALGRWENTVQAGVAAQAFDVPRIHVTGGPDDPVGRFWSLMDFVPGAPLLAGLSGVGALIRLPRLFARLPDQLASVAAQLHALDPEPVRAELEGLAGKPVGVDGLLAHYESHAAVLGDHELVRAAGRLTASRPRADRAVVCHGDLHPFNVLASGERLTLVDWTAAQVASPAYDVAFTALMLARPPLVAPGALRPAIRHAARAVSNRFVARYRAHSAESLPADALRWHTGLHSLRILLNIADWNASDPYAHRGHPFHAMAPSLRADLAGLTSS